MAGKARPSLRAKTLYNVEHSNLSKTDKVCIKTVFERYVEVVRCSECKYRASDECPLYSEEDIWWDGDGYMERDTIIHDNTTDNGFCDSGKRKESE
jgi:hypothetical protein